MLGDPRDPATDVASIANETHFHRFMDHIEKAKSSGAKLIFGGNAVNPNGAAGWFVELTIFDEVTSDMSIAQEEIFGPITAIIGFENEEDAVRIAYDTDFGLTTGIWTEDHRRTIRLADKNEAGTVYINNYFDAYTHSLVGVYKQSGNGRENDWEGLKDYVQTKSVWLSTAENIPSPFS